MNDFGKFLFLLVLLINEYLGKIHTSNSVYDWVKFSWIVDQYLTCQINQTKVNNYVKLLIFNNNLINNCSRRTPGDKKIFINYPWKFHSIIINWIRDTNFEKKKRPNIHLRKLFKLFFCITKYFKNISLF